MARDRNGRPVIGTAVPRSSVTGVSYPLYGSWGYWPPYYGSGFGWNIGFGFGAWNYYGGLWGPYGYWYNPYGYYPYYYPYDPFGTYYPYAYYEPRSRDDEHTGGSSSAHRETGSLRIKASPSTAKVYVDGTLMGTVDDFNGMTHHLELDSGPHQLELRAAGYQTLATDVTVTTGTTTVRLSMDKSKK